MTVLTSQQEQEVLDILGLLVRCIKNHGEDNQRTHLLDLTSLSSCLGSLLTSIGPLHITCTARALVVNGDTLPPRAGLSQLADLLARHRVTGFGWEPGISREELSRWLELLLYPTEVVGGLAQALRRASVTHITMAGRRRTGVLPDVARPGGRRATSGRLKLPEAAASRRGTPSEKLSSAGVRARSGKLAPPPDEAPAPPSDNLRLEVHELIAMALHRAAPKETAKLLSLARGTLPLGELLQQDPGVLVKRLEASDDEDQHVTLVAALIGVGKSALPHLLHCVGYSTQPQARASAMFALGKLVPDADDLLTRRLMEGCPPDETMRLLEAMQSARMPWNNVLNALLNSPNTLTRRGAYAFFIRTESLQRSAKIRVVSQGMASEQPWLVADAVRAAGILRANELAAKILAMLKKSFEKPQDALMVQREVCYALGRLRHEGALGPLKAIVFPGFTNKLVGFGQQPTTEREELRGAALWAIGRLPQPEARDVVIRAAEGSDQALRAVARVALDLQSSFATDPESVAILEA
ncbi:MAG TPA: HEAT repeat domain-containing protein [Candidatus Xenobia bacterium]|jgi:HEAT repeat protein